MGAPITLHYGPADGLTTTADPVAGVLWVRVVGEGPDRSVEDLPPDTPPWVDLRAAGWAGYVLDGITGDYVHVQWRGPRR